MGWKGFVRSVGAANKRAKKADSRAANQRAKSVGKIDRLDEQIDSEVARDRAKVQQFESRLAEKPISSCGLQYSNSTRRWSLKPIADSTGHFKWTVDVSFGNEEVSYDKPLETGGVVFEPIATAVTRYGVYIAIRRSGRPKRSLKLFYKSEPARNRLFLTISGVNYRALEGTLDEPDIDSVGIVAFPTVQSNLNEGQLRLLTDDGTVSASIRLNSTWSALGLAQKPVTEIFEDQLTGALATQRSQLKATRSKLSNPGCAVLVAALFVAGGSASAIVSWIL